MLDFTNLETLLNFLKLAYSRGQGRLAGENTPSHPGSRRRSTTDALGFSSHHQLSCASLRHLPHEELATWHTNRSLWASRTPSTPPAGQLPVPARSAPAGLLPAPVRSDCPPRPPGDNGAPARGQRPPPPCGQAPTADPRSRRSARGHRPGTQGAKRGAGRTAARRGRRATPPL